MSVQVWFDSEDTSIRPGESLSMSLSVENVGDHTESYTIIPAGLTASWTAITRPNVTLFGGSRDVIEVIVKPPAIHSTSSGPTSVAVRVVPQGSPDDSMTAETIINVEWFDDRRIVILQPLKRGRRRATFEFMVDNQGNSLANCRLHLIDASGRVDGSFDPPAVGVAPGSANLVRLKLTANRSLFRGTERQLNFEIEATEPDHAPVLGRATLIQPPTVSARSIGQVLATGLTVIAVIAAWVGIVRPELREAADRAVEQRLGDVTPLENTTEASPVSTTIVAVVEPGQQADTGQPVDYRIQVDAGITQDRSESISVPPDSRFMLTDIVLQNPHFDSGSAQLLRNGDTLYEWDLGEMTSPNEFQPRVTPLPFEPTDNIVLSVTCAEVTDTTATSCEIAVLLGGQLIPVADND